MAYGYSPHFCCILELFIAHVLNSVYSIIFLLYCCFIQHYISTSVHQYEVVRRFCCRQLNDELTAKTASLVQEADAVLVSFLAVLLCSGL